MKKNLNLVLSLVGIIMISCIFLSFKDKSPVKFSATKVSTESVGPLISICCDIARPKFDCKTGGGLCHCRVKIGGCGGSGGGTITDRTRELDVRVEGNNMFVEAGETLPSDASEFIFDEQVDLDPEVAKTLGYSKITILPGIYKVHSSANKQKVKLNIIAN